MSLFGIFLASSAAILWGVSYLIAEYVLVELHTSALLLLGSAITFTASSLFILATGSGGYISAPLESKTIFYALALCLVNLLATISIYTAIKHVGANIASIFEITYPLFVIVFSYFVFGTSLSIPTIIGALLMMVGAGLVVTTGSLS